MSDEYNNHKYCLNSFIKQLESDLLMTKDEGEDLKDMIYKGDGIYLLPDPYSADKERFSLCPEAGKESIFRKLASSMIYERNVVDGRSRTSLLNGNSFSALVGRFIFQYYKDGFKKYEKFFERVLKRAGENGFVDKALDNLIERYELDLGGGVSNVKKLVACVVYSFRSANMTIYDVTKKEFLPGRPPLKILSKGIEDFIWQIANADPKYSCSRFSEDFGLHESVHLWLKNYWPTEEGLEKGVYQIIGKDGPVLIDSSEFKVPHWFPERLDNFLDSLVKLYFLAGNGIEGGDGPGPKPGDGPDGGTGDGPDGGTGDGPDGGTGDGPGPKGGPNSGSTESEILFHKIFANDDVMAKILKKLAGLPEDERIRREEKIHEMFRSEPYKAEPVAMATQHGYLKTVNMVRDAVGIGFPIMTPSESREAKEYINEVSTPIDEERNRFWSMFHTVLRDGNKHFTICERAQYAAINLSYPTTRKAGPIIEFLYSQRRIVVGIYIADSTKTPCYDGMYWEKDEIERTVGRNLIWKSGDRNPNTKRVQYETSFNERDVLEGYRSKIEEILPIVEKFAEIADEYIPSEYRG